MSAAQARCNAYPTNIIAVQRGRGRTRPPECLTPRSPSARLSASLGAPHSAQPQPAGAAAFHLRQGRRGPPRGRPQTSCGVRRALWCRCRPAHPHLETRSARCRCAAVPLYHRRYCRSESQTPGINNSRFSSLRFSADLMFVLSAGAAVERLTDAMMTRPSARDGRMNLAFAPNLASEQ